MNWRELTWRDVAAAAGLLAFLLTMTALSVAPRFSDGSSANAGFGPEWSCKSQPKGDPICVRQVR